MEIMIRCSPKDEHKAIEFTREIVKRDLIPMLKSFGYSPTKYSVKYRTNKLKNHIVNKRRIKCCKQKKH